MRFQGSKKNNKNAKNAAQFIFSWKGWSKSYKQNSKKPSPKYSCATLFHAGVDVKFWLFPPNAPSTFYFCQCPSFPR